ncbi:hypothetical protein [Amnibacterium endophyticum]|uniref:Uncharacterized protein n=1 Tax=Amnibacterium endophyticum TaxID=2109337 RepID=A0ABW4LKD0_9MICO
MTLITAAETRFRPAGLALETGLLDEDGGSAIHTDLDRLAEEQQRVREATASLVARMNHPSAGPDEQDRLALDVARMLVLAEDLRQARAKAASRRTAAGRPWRTRLDLD